LPEEAPFGLRRSGKGRIERPHGALGAVVVVVRGPSGVGKSTVCAALAAELSATLLSQDTAVGQTSGQTADDKRRACLLIADLAVRAAERSLPVVVDGGFHWNADSDWVRAIGQATEAAGGAMIRVHLTASLGVLLERNRRRSKPMLDDDIRHYFEQYEALERDPGEVHVATDDQQASETTKTVKVVVMTRA
jgi:gluconate kinase